MEGYVRSRKFQNLNYIIITSFFRKVLVYFSSSSLVCFCVHRSLKNPFQIHIAKQDSTIGVNE